MSAGRRRLGHSGTTRGRRWTGWRLLVALLVLIVSRHTASAQTEVVEYYGQDALGSIRIVFNASGAAIARADYEPFGETFTVPGMPGTSGLPAKQFTGQERDAEASLDYFGARFYTPRTGRFSQVDPVFAGLFDPQQWNRYAYVRNNPLTFVDPTGRQVDSGIPGFCSAENSYFRCGGDSQFWGSLGGGGGFGDGYADALDGGYVPGMPAEMWADLQSHNEALKHTLNALAAQNLARGGDWAAAYKLLAQDSTLVLFYGPNVDIPAGASYQDKVDAMLKGHGLWDLIDWDLTTWVEGGYQLVFNPGVDLQAVFGENYSFLTGGLGLLHAGQTGWPNRDFRSVTGVGSPYSLQITAGPGGAWGDIDLYNPYQDVVSFLGHALEVLHIRRP